jgi:murein DD-endopeptidase MepM/ murein hydrolase activator NlpD
MALINQDFRPQAKRKRHPLLRWAVFATASFVLGVVIAKTSSNSQTADSLPSFKQVKPSQDEMARLSFELTLPELQAKQEIIDDLNQEPVKQWKEFTVKSGDSLSKLFKRAGFDPLKLDEVMKSGAAAKMLTKIFPKDIIRVLTDDEGELQALRYEIDPETYLMVEREAGQLVAREYKHNIETRVAHADGTIESSLFLAGNEAGIPEKLIMELAGIFGWDIDFVLDIRKGDSFKVLYEEIYRNGEKIKDGDILAAEFVNDGEVYRAVRYTHPDTNRTEYYTPEGKSMRKEFLRTPVNFTRISSGFTTKRFHPVLQRFRSHKGVDYAAKRGTPIRASGDGKVIFKGKKGGYGRVVIIQHGSKYTTLYAHLNSYNKKIRVGKRVKQGQTIAYVGSSGLATGPHLHYEFRVNGVHRNPQTVKLPSSRPVAKQHLALFELTTSPVLAQLDLLSRDTQLALAGTASADTE